MTLRQLTGLRFAAALAVFFWHAPATKALAAPLSLGYLGVGFFFVLSGFILTYTYRGAYSVRAFYVARAARVLPIHLFGMLLALGTLLLLGGEHWSEIPIGDRVAGFFGQAVLLQSWFPSPNIHFGINGPSWSLSDEAWFYAVFPLLGAGIARLFARSNERALLMAAALVCAVIAAAVSSVRVPFDQWAVYVLPLSRTGDFLVGMLLGSAFLRRAGEPDTRYATMREIAAVFALLCGVFVTAASPPAAHFYAAMLPFSALAVYTFAAGGGAISRFFSHPIAVRLGEASYAFYVVHFWIVRLIPNVLLSLAVTIVVSVVLFEFVETPLRRAIRLRWARTPQMRPPDAAAAQPAFQTR